MSTTTDPRGAARLDSIAWNRFHTVALLALGVGWALDSFEVTLISNLLGVLRGEWRLDGTAMSWLLGVWFIGLMVGAWGFGMLADRFGRKRVFLSSLVIYGSFTALTALAPTYGWLLVLRLLTAVGVGAEYSAINAAISELIPAAGRGRAAALVMSFWPLGAIAAAVLSLAVLKLLPAQLAWRAAFAFGAVIALTTLLLRRHLPESPRWLEKQGRSLDAHAIVERIVAGQVDFPPQPQLARLPADDAGNAARADRPWQGLATLARRYPGRLALGCVLDFSEAAGYYGLFAFLPLVVLPALKWPASALPWFYLIGNLGALAGGIAVGSLLERLGRKRTVTVCYALTALAMLALAQVSLWGSGWVLAGFTLANLLATASWIGAYPTFTELFPTRLRATGVGASVAFGRLGALGAPFLILAVSARDGLPAGLWVLTGFWVLGLAAMLVWSRFGVEARGRSLEALAPDPLTLS
jgi:MFS family permease